jgi:TonB-linked SusC/RagA family outer membrane protein
MKSIYNKWLFWLLMCPFFVMAQQGTMTGIISEKVSGQPLPGANAIVKGTTNGATTDFDGKYTLSKLKNGDVIEFSYIGFKNISLTYSGQKELNVALEEDASSLEEIKIVSIGYGTVRKQDATGAVDLLNAKDFNKGAVVTGSDLFQGKIAGVSVNTGGGSPGSVGQILIRGGSSLGAGNDPLVVLDGFPIGVGVLGSINPNDIESFSVLKDASATAIYGTRASNGVIMITTKKGGKKMQVEFNTQYGSGTPFNKIDVMNGPQFREAFKTVLRNGTYGSITNTYFPINGLTGNREFDEAGISQFLGTANTDWQDEIYRRTDFVENNLNVRGNLFNRIPTRIALGNTYQEGLLHTDELTRNTVNLSINPTFFNDHLKIDINVNYVNQLRRNAPGVQGAALRMAPTVPVFSGNSPYDGGYFEFMNPVGNPSNVNDFDRRAVANPVAQLFQTFNFSKSNNIIANATFDYKFHFFPKVRWVTMVGYDGGNGSYLNRKSRTSRTSPLFNDALIGDFAYGDGEGFNKILDSYLVYKQEGEKLKFDFTAGYSYQRFEGSNFNSGNVLNPNNIQIERRLNTPLVYIGFFGRSNITFLDKYILTLTYRRDGTSRFGPDRRWANTPAFSFAWKIKDEFFSNSKIISELKLRAGWGITGQQDIGAQNLHLPQYAFSTPNGSYPLGGGLVSPLLPLGYNPLVQWEETNTYNLGFDYGLFNNRLTGSVEVYYKLSDKLLQQAPFADGTNFTNLGPQNVGSLSIKGFEFSLNYNVFRTDNLNLNLNFNASAYRRRIDKMAQGQDLLTGASIGFTPIQVHSEGQVPSSFLLYQQAYDPNGVPIDGAFVDRNGDNLINEDDRYIFNDPDPDFLFGFGANFSFYNFDLGFNMRANVGNHVFNLVQATNSSYAALYENAALVNLNNVVTQTNFQTINNTQPISDLFVENASFLRMDYANLGYTFQKWLGGKASLRLFTGVQNPFIITNYSGLDPEIIGGVDGAIYPRPRQYLFGANIKF